MLGTGVGGRWHPAETPLPDVSIGALRMTAPLASASVRDLPDHNSQPSWILTRAAITPFLHVTGLVDPTLQHKNRAEVLVDGPEIVVRPVGTRQG